MVWIENQLLGQLWLTLTGLLFLYYTLWVIGLPFVEEDYKEALASYFPPLELALGVPAFLGSTLFLSLLLRAYQLTLMDRQLDKSPVS